MADIESILESKKEEILEPKKVDTPAPKKAAPKKAAPRTAAAKKQEYKVETDIKLFFVGISQILRAMPNGEILELQESEIEMLSKPIANILERNDLSETAGKYTDYTMLIVGAIIITVPRVILIRQKNEKKGGLQIVPAKTGTPNPTGRKDGKETSTNIPVDGESIHDLLDLFN